MRRRRSRSRKISRAATSRSTRSRGTKRGGLIDPFGGARDLADGVLRHVSPAFAEDPVRILRVARFAARFGFAIAPETARLMREMVTAGEIDALVPERVWQELAKGLMERTPRRMFEALAACGALERVLPEWRRLDARRALAALDTAAAASHPLPVRYAALFAGGPADAADAAAARLRAPADCRELAVLAASASPQVRNARALDAAALVGLLEQLDALRRPERFARSWTPASATRRRSATRTQAAKRFSRARLPPRRPSTRVRSRPQNRSDIGGAVRAARVAAVAGAAL